MREARVEESIKLGLFGCFRVVDTFRVAAVAMLFAVSAAADAGADVLDVGMVGTEMVYFAVGELDLDGGIQVTASHNPKEYTGMKIVRRGALPVGGDTGLDKIKARIPIGRLGQAQEIARGVAFLVSDDAGFVTGSTLSINGGQHMY